MQTYTAININHFSKYFRQSVARYNVPIPSRDSDKVTLKIETKDFENHLEVKVCTG